jgi:hypothetical protein
MLGIDHLYPTAVAQRPKALAKTLLDRQLSDLCVTLLDFHPVRNIRTRRLAREDAHEAIFRLALPLRDQIEVTLVARRRLGENLIAFKALGAICASKPAGKLRRFTIS